MRPQPPQWSALERVSISHPSASRPLQSAKPVVQVATSQALMRHAAVALERVGHARPHAPQCAAVDERSTSQPLAGSPSQSPKPGRHVKPHALIAQTGSALGTAGHAIPHAPQCAAVTRTSVSQPFEASPSQSPKPPAQSPTPHAPMRHAGVALGGTGQVRPHAPQFETSFEVDVSHPLAALMSQSA